MSAPHPAYPTTAEVRLHGDAVRLATREWENNGRIRRILQEALTQLDRTCDMDGHSMAPGYNLRDIRAGVADMLPLVDDHDQTAALDAWAWEHVGDAL